MWPDVSTTLDMTDGEFHFAPFLSALLSRGLATTVCYRQWLTFQTPPKACLPSVSVIQSVKNL